MGAISRALLTGRILWKDVIRDFGAHGDNSHDDSAIFTTALASVASGDGVLWVPKPSSAYLITDVTIPAGVTVLVAAGTTFKPYTPSVINGSACWRLGDFTATYYDDMALICTGGSFTIDMTGQTATNLRGVNILNARHFKVEGIRGVAIPNTAGNTVACGTNSSGRAPQHGEIRRIRNESVSGVGASCIQFTGGFDILCEMLSCDGGVAARLEMDNFAGAVADNVIFRSLFANGDSGFANSAFYIEPHSNTARNVLIEGFRATGGADGGRINYDLGITSPPESFTIRRGRVSGGGKGISTQSTLDMQPPRGSYHDITVVGATGAGFEYMGGSWYDCHAISCGGVGFTPASEPSGHAGLVARFHNCSGIANTASGMIVDNHDRVDLIGCTANDPASAGGNAPNQLTTQEAGVESSTAALGWQSLSNSTVARSTTQKHTGTASLLTTSAASGGASARIVRSGTNGIPVVVGTSYYAEAYLRSVGTTRTGAVKIRWYDSTGAFLSDSSGTGVSVTNSAFVQTTITATAPASAAYAGVYILYSATAAAGEAFYSDDHVFRTATFSVTQNYGLDVRTGQTVHMLDCDLTGNGSGRFTSAGTVKEYAGSTVTS